MKIVTNRGQEFKVNWAWETRDERLMISLPDTRRIAEIAEDFDGLVKMERFSEEEGDAVYIGYENMTSVVKEVDTGNVLLTFRKGDAK